MSSSPPPPDRSYCTVEPRSEQSHTQFSSIGSAHNATPHQIRQAQSFYTKRTGQGRG